VAAGFGIATADQVAEVARTADGVIVGSAIVRVLEEHLGRSDLVTQVGDFAAALRAATARPVAAGRRPPEG
jgi:tryptophan synthase alpha chain